MILVLSDVKAVENLGTNTVSYKTKMTYQENMVKLMLQHEQFRNVKSSTLALSTKITVVKSPKT